MFFNTFLSFMAIGLIAMTSADVELIAPASGASIAGGAVTLKWQDSGANPALAAIAAADVILCTGTDLAPITLLTLAGSVPLGTTTSLAVTIPVTIGANGQYFIKFVETTGGGSVVTTYSDRFTLTGMTGTIVANVGLAATGPVGTTPAAALLETAAATKAATAPAGTATEGATLAAGALAAYATQTAITRSARLAPMSKPGSSITAPLNKPVPLFPTSLYTIFTAAGPAPVAKTTLTASPTWTVVSLVNGASPATFTGN